MLRGEADDLARKPSITLGSGTRMNASTRSRLIAAKDGANAPALAISMTASWTPIAFAACVMCFTRISCAAIPGFTSTATLLSRGIASFSTASCFPAVSALRKHQPVMLPPGLARLAINPCSTGSCMAITIGIVAVAPWAAIVAAGPPASNTSTFARTSSAASAGSRSSRPSAKRRSINRFRPST
jgi:hypothetical protein